MKLYYWNRLPNLGDQLNRLLFPQAEWAPPSDAEWVGAGSVLESFDGFTGTVFGTGRAGPHSPPTDLRQARVLALRGLRTRELVLTDAEVVLGDPGLLADGLVEPDQQGYTAIVPHWSDQARMLTTYPGTRFVDVTGPPMRALQMISGAAKVISSSLHGIVLADAFGVPRMWDWFDGVQGGGFKFADHGSVVGAFEPGEWHQPDVSHIQQELRECLTPVSAS